MTPFARRNAALAAAVLGVCAVAGAAFAQTLAQPSYTAAQAERGKTAYMGRCASCHGDALDNGQFAAALVGPAFTAHWGAGGLDAPFQVMLTQMPPEEPGALGPAAYADILAFILRENGVPVGQAELPSDVAVLKGLAAPH